MREQRVARPSAFMAIGALLGVEIFGCDAIHIVALDADAMEHVLGVTRGGCVRAVCWWCLGRFRHEDILT